jgi:virginiamycin B lyase
MQPHRLQRRNAMEFAAQPRISHVLVAALVAALGGCFGPQQGSEQTVLPQAGSPPPAMKEKLQIIFQFPGAPKTPLLIATDGSGKDWFSECGKTTIAYINESTDKYSQFNTSFAKSCGGDVALGPNRTAMWFTDPNEDKIGYIALTDHRFHVYRGPTPNWLPFGITAGPDNAMWFTESSEFEQGYYYGKIGRLDLSKRPFRFSEFALPYYGGQGQPAYIASGSDGALWFTDDVENIIGRITTAGKMSYFSLPSPWVDPIAIAPGPDGALWFTGYTNSNQPYVGRIDPVSHAISSYRISTSLEGTSTIVARGSDLWFTENQSSKIGCINSTTHQTHEYDLPPAESPWGITEGTNGSLWITETLTSSLANYLPPGPCST